MTLIQITRFAGRSGHIPRNLSRCPLGTDRITNMTISTAAAGAYIITGSSRPAPGDVSPFPSHSGSATSHARPIATTT